MFGRLYLGILVAVGLTLVASSVLAQEQISITWGASFSRIASATYQPTLRHRVAMDEPTYPYNFKQAHQFRLMDCTFSPESKLAVGYRDYFWRRVGVSGHFTLAQGLTFVIDCGMLIRGAGTLFAEGPSAMAALTYRFN